MGRAETGGQADMVFKFGLGNVTNVQNKGTNAVTEYREMVNTDARIVIFQAFLFILRMGSFWVKYR